MKKSVYSRVPSNVSDELEVSEKPKIIQEAIEDMKYQCPMCKKPWPVSPKLKETKSHIAVRVDPEVAKQVVKLENMSKYICVALQLKLGICPVCGMKTR